MTSRPFSDLVEKMTPESRARASTLAQDMLLNVVSADEQIRKDAEHGGLGPIADALIEDAKRGGGGSGPTDKPLGDRMKGQYEDRTRILLPRRTYTIVRVDGKAFHSYTAHCDKPNDARIGTAMDKAAARLCREMQGSRFAYVQSDEISVLLTDFETPTTEAWFDGNLQKIASVAASIATMAFNFHGSISVSPDAPLPPTATFDARVFTIPDPTEVENYFIWRQKDAERNSIEGLCRVHYSHREMHGKARTEQHDMLHAKGVNWNDLPAYWKRGRCVVRAPEADASRPAWALDSEIPVFTQDRAYLSDRIPKIS